MASSQSMLEQMLEAAIRGGGLRAGEEAGTRGRPAPGGSGNLGDILGSLLGGAAAGAGSGAPTGQAGGLGDILGSILGGLANGGAGGEPETDPASGRTQPRQRPPSGLPQQQAEVSPGSGMGDLARYGGLAVIGVLAYQALKRYQAQQGNEPEQTAAGSDAAAALVPPPDSAFRPNQARGGPDALSGVLVKAMVAATQADGVIDEEEQRRLLGRLDQLGMGSIDRQALAEQLTTPIDPDEISSAATSPEVGLQIYAASVLAVAVDTAEERRYLDELAQALGIKPGLKAQVEQTLGRA
jgi:uncharacterized membrane protein YebE (DUF533 family)